MSYLLLKMLHLLGVIGFLGNIATGLFWAAHAHRQKEFSIIGITFRGIIQSDRWFTVPGVWIILIGGFATAIVGKVKILATGWIFWPIVLFSVSGVVFVTVLVPLQRKISEFVAGNEQTNRTWNIYCAMYKKWEIWGLVALLGPVAATIIMILKPGLPGL